MRCLLAAAIALPAILWLPGAALAATCSDYISDQLEIMKDGARKCGANAAAMATFPNMNPPGKLNCTTPIDTRLTQLSSFEQCSRVYYCGAKVYTCALQRAPKGVSALDRACGVALQGCLKENPVPR